MRTEAVTAGGDARVRVHVRLLFTYVWNSNQTYTYLVAFAPAITCSVFMCEESDYFWDSAAAGLTLQLVKYLALERYPPLPRQIYMWSVMFGSGSAIIRIHFVLSVDPLLLTCNAATVFF